MRLALLSKVYALSFAIRKVSRKIIDSVIHKINVKIDQSYSNGQKIFSAFLI